MHTYDEPGCSPKRRFRRRNGGFSLLLLCGPFRIEDLRFSFP
jgi:hypothetical protein